MTACKGSVCVQQSLAADVRSALQPRHLSPCLVSCTVQGHLRVCHASHGLFSVGGGTGGRGRLWQECLEYHKEPSWASRKGSTHLAFHPNLTVGLRHLVFLQRLKEKRRCIVLTDGEWAFPPEASGFPSWQAPSPGLANIVPHNQVYCVPQPDFRIFSDLPVLYAEQFRLDEDS